MPDTPILDLPMTWPRFRLAQRDIRKGWGVAPAVPDDRLPSLGWNFAGVYRTAEKLSEPERYQLLGLLRMPRKTQDADQLKTEAALLGRCAYEPGPMVPLDLDVNGASEDVIAAARARLDAVMAEHGWGKVSWRKTGGSGWHGDQQVPWQIFSDTSILGGYALMAERLGVLADVPLLSKHMDAKDRPPVVLDDTLFRRRPESRGMTWRLLGARHPDTGRRKAVQPGEIEEPIPGSPIAIGELINEARKAETNAAARQKILSGLTQPKKTRTPIDLRGAALRCTIEVLGRVMPPRGQRHLFRLMVAGWLLRRGVDPEIVSQTLTSAGDEIEARDVVKTTWQRIQAEAPVMGWRKLAAYVGDRESKNLARALDEDMVAAGVIEKGEGWDSTNPLTADERLLYAQAAKLAEAAGNDRAVKALERARFCGYRTQEGECSKCGKVCGKRHFIAAERATCPHCSMSRARDLANWVKTKWPEKLWMLLLKLDDTSPEAARAGVKTIKKALMDEFRHGHRYIRGPGYVLFVSANPRIDLSESLHRLGLAQVSREDAAKAIRRVVGERSVRVREYLNQRDIASLASDPWLTKRMVEASADKVGRTTLPWPSRDDLRLLAKNARRARNGQEPIQKLSEDVAAGSACCQAQVVWALYGNNGQVLVYGPRPFTFEDGAFYERAVERGWVKRGAKVDPQPYGARRGERALSFARE